VTGENNHSDVMKHLRYSVLQSVVTPLISCQAAFRDLPNFTACVFSAIVI